MKILTKADYLNAQFEYDKQKYSNQDFVQTGLSGIDDHMALRPGVYLLGGMPSVGKTTLVLQLADHFANLGKKVLFFSLEQSEYDLTTKSLNRIKHQLDVDDRVALDKYKKTANNITTAVSASVVTVESIERIVDDYVQEIDASPIVFIDYLQLIQSKSHMSKRDCITHVSNTLVNIAKTYGITMFVLSSLNRMNYTSPIDFEAFKESGSLEYDADVVFGLQYQIVSSDKFINCNSVDQKRLMIGEAKTENVRKVELVCLKNRFGPIAPVCKLDYHTNADLFADSKSNATNSAYTNKKTCKF